MRTLPIVKLTIGQRECRALVDTGCTDTLVHAGACRTWEPRHVSMATVNGGTLNCVGVTQLTVTYHGVCAELVALVVRDRPLGVDMVLGMSGIVAMGGISLTGASDVRIGVAGEAMAVAAAAEVVSADAEVTRAAVGPEVTRAAVGPEVTRAVAAAEVTRAAAAAEVTRAVADAEVTRVAADVVTGAAAAMEVREAAVAAAEVGGKCLSIDATDFTAKFSAASGEWTVGWKWADGNGPDELKNGTAQYSVPETARQAYDEELQLWIQEGWLQPYDEQTDGPARGLIPLMAVVQPNQDKVRPVMDYRELNSHITAHTAEADVCAEQLRRWRRHGSRIAVVDLRKAYLQLRLDRRLWPYHTVEVNGRRYTLTRCGFGLSVAPLIMKAVVRSVLEQDDTIGRGVLSYVDDLLVDEDIVSAERVIEHFSQYGLACKPPQRAADGARLLGLRVNARAGELEWRRDNPVDPPPQRLTRRSVFAWCGQLVAHLPVAGWLRPTAAWLKRRVNALTRGWDDPTDDPELRAQVSQVADRVTHSDPAHGPWRLKGEKLIVWTDASSLASGVVLEEGGVVEDASWLRPESKAAMHINMAELDAALSGINLAIAWGIKDIDLRTDSATVSKWISDALDGRSRLRTKAHGEMLIRRRIEVIRELVSEFHLRVAVTLIRSEANLADALTRVPKEWLRTDRTEDGPPPPVIAATVSERRESADMVRIRTVHEQIGHQGIKRTLWYLRRDGDLRANNRDVRAVIEHCDVCRSIDPAPKRWRHGSLDVEATWDRLAVDVTHYRNKAYLTVIDCGPSRYGLW